MLILSLLTMAHASEHIIVFNADTDEVERYDSDTGAETASLEIPMNAASLSEGRRYLYIQDDDRVLHLLQLSDFQQKKSPDQLSASSSSLAVMLDRERIYAPGDRYLEEQDASADGYLSKLLLGDIEHVATSGWDEVYFLSAGLLFSYSTSTQHLTTLSTQSLGFDVTQLAVSPYSSLVVAVGEDVLSGQSLKSPGEPIHVAVWYGGTLTTTTIPSGLYTGGVAFDQDSPSQFFVGSQAGYTVLQAGLQWSGTGPQGSLTTVSTAGRGAVMDLTATDAGDIYALFDDRVSRISSTKEETMLTFADSADRTRLLVAPAPDPADILTVREAWAGMSLVFDQCSTPLPWSIRDDCAACDTDNISAVFQTWKHRPCPSQTMSPADTISLLAEVAGEEESVVQAFVDDMLINMEESVWISR